MAQKKAEATQNRLKKPPVSVRQKRIATLVLKDFKPNFRSLAERLAKKMPNGVSLSTYEAFIADSLPNGVFERIELMPLKEESSTQVLLESFEQSFFWKILTDEALRVSKAPRGSFSLQKFFESRALAQDYVDAAGAFSDMVDRRYKNNATQDLALPNQIKSLPNMPQYKNISAQEILGAETRLDQIQKSFALNRVALQCLAEGVGSAVCNEMAALIDGIAGLLLDEKVQLDDARAAGETLMPVKVMSFKGMIAQEPSEIARIILSNKDAESSEFLNKRFGELLLNLNQVIRMAVHQRQQEILSTELESIEAGNLVASSDSNDRAVKIREQLQKMNAAIDINEKNDSEEVLAEILRGGSSYDPAKMVAAYRFLGLSYDLTLGHLQSSEGLRKGSVRRAAFLYQLAPKNLEYSERIKIKRFQPLNK